MKDESRKTNLKIRSGTIRWIYPWYTSPYSSVIFEEGGESGGNVRFYWLN